MPGIADLLGTVGAAAGGPAGLAVNTGVQAAVGVAQMVQAGKQNREAKKLQKNFVNPTYQIAKPILDNQALAESRAGQGLSDAALSVYRDNVNRSMTASIDAILRGGGNVNSISDLNDASEDNFAQIALLEEEVRMKNTQTYLAQNERLAAELDKQFQINEYAPAQDKKQLIAALRQQANDNKWKGINTIGSAVGNFIGANQLNNETNSIFGSRRQPSAVGAVTRPSGSTPAELIGNSGLGPQSLRDNPTGRLNLDDNSYLRGILGMSNILNRPR